MKHTRTAVAAVGLAAAGLLGACSSQPSVKAVAKDIVQSFDPPLPQAQQDCMVKVINEMPTDQLKKLGTNNVGKAITSAGGGDADMQAFIDQLKACQPAG